MVFSQPDSDRASVSKQIIFRFQLIRSKPKMSASSLLCNAVTLRSSSAERNHYQQVNLALKLDLMETEFSSCFGHISYNRTRKRYCDTQKRPIQFGRNRSQLRFETTDHGLQTTDRQSDFMPINNVITSAFSPSASFEMRGDVLYYRGTDSTSFLCLSHVSSFVWP